MAAARVGATVLFAQAGGTWSQRTRLASPAGVPGDRFGWSVVLAQDTGVLVGAPYALEGCGSATLRASGAAALGSNFTLQLTGTGSPFLGVGLTSFELPICSCILGHDWSTSFPTGTLSVGIPNDPLLIGGQVALQGLDLGAGVVRLR